MGLIPTSVHGVIDYLVGAILIIAPWLFGFAAGGAETWIPVILGAGVILYSLLTDYETGIWGLLPVPAHLWLDGLGGLVLAASPWMFGFADQVWAPHLVVGILEIGVAVTTRTTPQHGAVAGGIRAVSPHTAPGDHLRPRATGIKEAYPAEPR